MRTVQKTDLDGGAPDQARPDAQPDLADGLQDPTGGLSPDFGALVAAEIPGLYCYALSLAGNRAEAEGA